MHFVFNMLGDGYRFAIEGAHVILAGRMSKSLKQKLRPGITLTEIAGSDNIDEGAPGTNGKDDNDDIHLIMEYKRGENWGHYASPRANRCNRPSFHTSWEATIRSK